MGLDIEDLEPASQRADVRVDREGPLTRLVPLRGESPSGEIRERVSGGRLLEQHEAAGPHDAARLVQRGIEIVGDMVEDRPPRSPVERAVAEWEVEEGRRHGLHGRGRGTQRGTVDVHGEQAGVPRSEGMYETSVPAAKVHKSPSRTMREPEGHARGPPPEKGVRLRVDEPRLGHRGGKGAPLVLPDGTFGGTIIK